jgi:hypothetical protein
MGDLSHPADAIELPDPQALLRNDSGHRDFSNIDGRSDILEIPPEHAVSALPAWNQNRANVFKTFSTFSAFIIMGANDAAYGVSEWSIASSGRKIDADKFIGHYTLCKLHI